MNEDNKCKILIAPLDWGLGHATRCIVIIRNLLQHNFDVTIAVSGRIKHLLQAEFPDTDFVDLPGYKISYSRYKRLLPLKILIQIPKILKIIRYENKWLKALLKQQHFDIVISDNRYGLYAADVKSVFITHQLIIKTNFLWLDKKLQRLNYKFITRFAQCWIPDFENNPNIAGDLSHPEILPGIQIKYIGPLSRFEKTDEKKNRFKWTVLISGPEPQRSIFEKKIFEAAAKTNEKFLIIRGLPGEKEKEFYLPNCKVFNHLNTNDLQFAIESGEFIVSRCGYTTVMEILSLKKKSVFIPTPGQTEQEYLAHHLSKQKWSYTFNQKADFASHFDAAKKFEYAMPDIDMKLNESLLSSLIKSLID